MLSSALVVGKRIFENLFESRDRIKFKIVEEEIFLTFFQFMNQLITCSRVLWGSIVQPACLLRPSFSS